MEYLTKTQLVFEGRTGRITVPVGTPVEPMGDNPKGGLDFWVRPAYFRPGTAWHTVATVYGLSVQKGDVEESEGVEGVDFPKLGGIHKTTELGAADDAGQD